jgi:Zn-dependent protease
VLLFSNFSLEAIIATILVMLLSMTVHEFAHAAMATYWGDDTPRAMGRLTLNPFVHINWIGFLMFIVVGFGILGSVPVNERRMRSPRWGSFWTSFAGPLANLTLAIFFGIAIRMLYDEPLYLLTYFYGSEVPALYDNPLMQFLGLFLIAGVFWNLLLFFFNLLPFFPIDGWRMVLALLPGYWLRRDQVPAFVRQSIPPLSQFLQQPAYKWAQWAQVSQIILFILIMISFVAPRFNLLGAIISGPTFNLLFNILGV